MADAYGTAAATAAGGIAVVGGYIGMSYSGDLPPLLVLCYALVGLGSGCTFLASLSTAINTTKAWAVALVSLCMSLSISFTVSLLEFYESHFEVRAGGGGVFLLRVPTLVITHPDICACSARNRAVGQATFGCSPSYVRSSLGLEHLAFT